MHFLEPTIQDLITDREIVKSDKFSGKQECRSKKFSESLKVTDQAPSLDDLASNSI